MSSDFDRAKLDIAFMCMLSDGEIDQSEIECLRSIAVQQGIEIEDVKKIEAEQRDLYSIGAEAFIKETFRKIKAMQLDIEQQSGIVATAVEMVEADGDVHTNESAFLRLAFRELDFNREDLIDKHPEWEEYLTSDFINPLKVWEFFPVDLSALDQ